MVLALWVVPAPTRAGSFRVDFMSFSSLLSITLEPLDADRCHLSPLVQKWGTSDSGASFRGRKRVVEVVEVRALLDPDCHRPRQPRELVGAGPRHHNDVQLKILSGPHRALVEEGERTGPATQRSLDPFDRDVTA